MTTIELRFLANRYHANPWGRHVNEGVPEWPPSPYRLIRALYDTWKRKCAHLSEDRVRDLFRALASEPPSFELPAATASHTRSYLSSNTEDPNDKSLVFDGFLAFDPEACCQVTWPSVKLSREEREALTELLRVLNFLGRSESWVDARVCETGNGVRWNCEPVVRSNARGQLAEVACAVREEEYTGKRPWLDALTYSTGDLFKEKRNIPPAMRMVPYVQGEHLVRTYVPGKVTRPGPKAQAILLALDSSVLPLATASMEVAEQIRVKLMGIHKRIMDNDPSKVSPLFSGKTADGEPRRDHGHIFILPQANEKGRIDRVLLLSKLQPFSTDELRAVLSLRLLWQADGRPDVRCVVTWQGGLEDGPVRRTSQRVMSATPFVLARHWRRGRDWNEFLRSELRRECDNHGILRPIRIETVESRGLFEWVEYRRNRKDEAPRTGFGLRLEFASEVLTPFSLGYGCHFGLGQFVAE